MKKYSEVIGYFIAMCMCFLIGLLGDDVHFIQAALIMYAIMMAKTFKIAIDSSCE